LSTLNYENIISFSIVLLHFDWSNAFGIKHEATNNRICSGCILLGNFPPLEPQWNERALSPDGYRPI
jgi:hypothetical protein